MSQDRQCLDRCEARTHAKSRAASKRYILETVPTAFRVRAESFVVEGIRILPQRRVAMDEPGPDRYDIPGCDLFTPEPVGGHGLTVEARNRWVQTQGLFEYLSKQRKPVGQQRIAIVARERLARFFARALL